MDVEAVLNEKLADIRARYKGQTGHDLDEASLWFYGDRWVVFLRANGPRYDSHCDTAATFAEIDAVAAEVVKVLAERSHAKPTPAQIAQQMGLSEDELCQIVCAAKHAEAA